MKQKAVALMSGGLDSTVAVKLIVEQGIEVVALNFKSPFCLCDGKTSGGCKSHAQIAAEQIGIEVKVRHKELDYLDIIRSPKFGYGSAINPCVDCRIYTFKKAAAYMEEIGASFIVTGEVLGQRPMSQRRDPMFLIERESSLEGLIVRPLSAKLLPPTIPEEKGILDREKFLSISGRSRKEQIKVASDYKIEDYPCASGGCLLTDKNFEIKLKDAFDHKENLTWLDIKLLTIGRHFRFSDNLKAVAGRNEEENRRLSLICHNRPLLRPLDFAGPTIHIDGPVDKNVIDRAGALLLRLSKAKEGENLEIEFLSDMEKQTYVINKKMSESDIESIWLK